MNLTEFVCSLFRSESFPKGVHVRLKSNPSKTGFAITPKITKVKVRWNDGTEEAEFVDSLEIVENNIDTH